MQHEQNPLLRSNPTASVDLPANLPAGSEIDTIAFVAAGDVAGTTLVTFAHPRTCRAVVGSNQAPPSSTASEPPVDLTLLRVPSGDLESAELLSNLWNWAEPEIPVDRRQGLLITLHGARIVWTPTRVAIVAAAERLDTLRLAVVEFAFHDGEIRALENAVSQAWPNLEQDSPLAFKFDEQNAPRRDELSVRYQQMLALRSRLVRVNPVIHRPPVHPPTLASQLAERLKERTRLVERIEFLDAQIDVFEGVYEQCGQRSHEFALSRKEQTLEWIIIVFLAIQTVMLLVELVSNQGN